MIAGSPHPIREGASVSFQFGATAGKHTEIRKNLQADRDSKLRGDEYDVQAATSRPGADVGAVQRARDELEGDLAEAGIAAAEAAARKLKGASSYQVTVSGHQNPDGTQAVSVAVNAAP
jgi:hypothetical protein